MESPDNNIPIIYHMDSIITETTSLNDIGSTIISDYASETPEMNTNWYIVLKYGLIIIVLALLGFNLFTFLGNTTDIITNIFGYTFSKTGDTVGNIAATTTTLTAKGTKGIVNLAAEGTKSLADITSGTLTSGVNLLEKGINMKQESNPRNVVPQPDEAGNVTQRENKSGYCYIGEDRGFRSCVKVGNNDKCMSGDIFPTEEICINPNLRE